jgi:hypothetical protein
VSRRGTADAKVVGATLISLGTLAAWEGWRLREVRMMLVAGTVVGDDTFPLLIGIALVALGVYLVAAAPLPSAAVALPRGRVRAQMLGGGGLLIGYWLALPWLGYTLATALAAVGLFRALGGYRWAAAILFGALTAAALHLLFRVWLVQPLPLGIFGAALGPLA